MELGKGAKDVWCQVCEDLRQKMSDETFTRWILPAVPVSFSGNIFELGVANNMFSIWLEDNYKGLILESLNRVTGTEVSLKFSEGYQEPIEEVPVVKSLPRKRAVKETRPEDDEPRYIPG